jgi:hypothetical protein
MSIVEASSDTLNTMALGAWPYPNYEDNLPPARRSWEIPERKQGPI